MNQVNELNLAAKSMIEQKRFDEARKTLEQSLAVQKNAVAYRYMGVLCRLTRQLPEALVWHQESLKLAPEDPATLSQLAETFFDAGDLLQACAYYAFAIRHDPANIAYLERFIGMSQRVNFVNYSEVVEDAVVTCLKTPQIDVYPLQALWFNTFLLHPALQPLYAPSKGLLGGLFGKAAPETLPSGAALKPLLSPFFLLGLRHLTIFNLEFENFIARLRRTLLQETDATLSALGNDGFAQLAGAVSHYAYNTEYILVPTPAEAALTESLKQKIASQPGAHLVALYACYAPLHLLPNAKEIEQTLVQSPISDVVALQLTEHFALQARRLEIPAITSIDDEVSKLVREQYEESPYPKWGKLPKWLVVEKPAAALQQKGAQILVAGCGTGHEALQYAVLFPEAEVLAVDLSLTSMAYGLGKAREFGITNITFRQADILRLGEIGRQFDCIVSGGVLHHIKDMFRAWQVLTGMLKPNGVMKIALYSRTARRNLLAFHDIIRKSYPGLDLAGMRNFRHNSEKIAGKKLVASLSGFEDYYHLSMYRDMMFHVQERNLNLDEISDMLDKLGLSFLEFSLPQPVKTQYTSAFPHDPPGGTLAHWANFEKAAPDTFKACYIFWCRKN